MYMSVMAHMDQTEEEYVLRKRSSPLGLSLALLKRMLVLKLRSHFVCR
jgi:hypothetical protein